MKNIILKHLNELGTELEKGYGDKLIILEKKDFEKFTETLVEKITRSDFSVNFNKMVNNNGWIKIESEKDLPNEKCELFVKNKEKNDIFICTYINSFFTPIHKTCSHYHLLIKPKPPID